jgi:hypothetical protein
MCVDRTYPLARTQARTLGKAPDNSTTSDMAPVGSSASAEQVQFVFVAGTKAADLQVVNLHIDPSMHW